MHYVCSTHPQRKRSNRSNRVCTRLGMCSNMFYRAEAIDRTSTPYTCQALPCRLGFVSTRVYTVMQERTHDFVFSFCSTLDPAHTSAQVEVAWVCLFEAGQHHCHPQSKGCWQCQAQRHYCQLIPHMGSHASKTLQTQSQMNHQLIQIQQQMSCWMSWKPSQMQSGRQLQCRCGPEGSD